MKFTHVEELRLEDILEKGQEHQPVEFAQSLLKNFDHLLGVIKEQKPIILDTYVTNLEARYQQLAKQDEFLLRNGDVVPLLTELIHLRDQAQLAKFFLNYHFQQLQLAKDTEWKRGKVEIPLRTFLCARYLPPYTYLQVLTETIPRDEAIQLFKDHINDYVRSRIAEKDDRYQTLEGLRDMLLKMGEWGVIGNVSEVDEGKLISRRDTCLHEVALRDIPDQELKFLVCCFGDYEGVRSFNKHFKLTMKHTLVRGDPYCDCVYYDTRITTDFTHPPKNFFDSIWPLIEKNRNR
jgi:hypothetical protein